MSIFYILLFTSLNINLSYYSLKNLAFVGETYFVIFQIDIFKLAKKTNIKIVRIV